MISKGDEEVPEEEEPQQQDDDDVVHETMFTFEAFEMVRSFGSSGEFPISISSRNLLTLI